MRNLEGQADRVMDETDDVSGAWCLCVCVYMSLCASMCLCIHVSLSPCVSVTCMYSYTYTLCRYDSCYLRSCVLPEIDISGNMILLHPYVYNVFI